ncbi:hypothetical protein GCM10009777_17790 [Microbacterium pumilum]|uniref:Uncharacterized protein n=1 Tax=Microbacterium pumilum TaxID=344165 RepID=A0ABN2SD14_9MICO
MRPRVGAAEAGRAFGAMPPDRDESDDMRNHPRTGRRESDGLSPSHAVTVGQTDDIQPVETDDMPDVTNVTSVIRVAISPGTAPAAASS